MMQAIGFWGVFQLACLGLFSAINGVRTVSLLVRHKVNPIKLRVNKRGVHGLIEFSLFVGVNLWAVAIVFGAVAPGVLSGSLLFSPLLPAESVARYVGLLVVVLSFVILVFAQVTLGNAWRLGIDKENPGELVTHGIYALCRNPIYLFFDLYFFGTFLLNGTLFFALATVFTVVNLHYQILKEEQHLADLYGSDYRAYFARTARYLPTPSALRSSREAQSVDTG
jgi:protein-S-isoprenylcysteine O-methyltransferase Ste14